jgi:hypothetical protein
VKGIILCCAAAVSLSFLLSARTRVSRIRKEVAEARERLSDVEGIMRPQQSSQLARRALQTRANILDAAFPGDQAQTLRALAETAQKVRIELVSVRPQPEYPVLGESGSPMSVDGLSLKTVRVSLEMRCPYQDIVRYLSDLRTQIAAYLQVERFSVDKPAPPETQLHAVLEVSIYLLSRKEREDAA